jgi:hypothetical protein
LTEKDIHTIENTGDILETAERIIFLRTPKWFIGFRDITNATNERSVIAAVLPFSAVGHTCPLIFLPDPDYALCLVSNLNAFVFDYFARQKITGTHLTYNLLKQMPVLPSPNYDIPAPDDSGQTMKHWLIKRVVELVYTAWDLKAFAGDFGFNHPPFFWDTHRRLHIQSEIDAAFFLMYGLEEKDVSYILDTFPIVKRKDEKKYGIYKTKIEIIRHYHRLKTFLRQNA